MIMYDTCGFQKCEFYQILTKAKFYTKSAGMLGCYGVKFRCRWNWLKIDIQDLQALYNKAMYLVSFIPVSPYPKNIQARRVPPLSTNSLCVRFANFQLAPVIE